jgi:hypothetical protein
VVTVRPVLARPQDLRLVVLIVAAVAAEDPILLPVLRLAALGL